MWRQGFWRGLQFLWWCKGVGLLLYKYNEEWDKYLLALLATETFGISSYGSSHVCQLGSEKIWCANHPYASFVPWNNGDVKQIRPSLFTIFLAEEKFIKETGRMPL